MNPSPVWRPPLPPLSDWVGSGDSGDWKEEGSTVGEGDTDVAKVVVGEGSPVIWAKEEGMLAKSGRRREYRTRAMLEYMASLCWGSRK